MSAGESFKLMLVRPLFLIAAAGFVSSLAADLPVREVVLYKNGVGYFERGGPLAPGTSARLDFRPEEMDDVLKSLTVRDTSGASVSNRWKQSSPSTRSSCRLPSPSPPCLIR